ncbi:formylglycine-generating enzyme family protein [Paracoccus siganidrum]|uniref:Formylglycine-generating enzyme family protein n=3 Tax=Paracoccus siganidrum TaxID=1276757 RepID=A0A418ZZ39_9RHOB|nr:formylglycine-generating enzyme family protein [Paracoccus siganidrum]RMC38790.1 formylglycine-generating enzyme family protein [Paracoccus siganidrum]
MGALRYGDGPRRATRSGRGESRQAGGIAGGMDRLRGPHRRARRAIARIYRSRPMEAQHMQSAPSFQNRRHHYLERSPPPGAPPYPDTVWVPGGDFRLGSDRFYPEEAPVRSVEVRDFWMDRAPVTNAVFACFVSETGYVTTAERGANSDRHRGIDPALLQPSGLVFDAPAGVVPLNDPRRWWRFTPGASWRLPYGRPLAGVGASGHPVVQVSHLDAHAFAEWMGKALSTEAEWEFVARGGLDGATFCWGDREIPTGGRRLANTWQGPFPYKNSREDGYRYTSLIRSYPANGYGLCDMTGNLWEWTADRA